jgi:hypothetical protein
VTPAAPAALVLLHSPLTGRAVWGRLPGVLRDRGFPVVVPEVTGDDEPPFAARYVARAALEIAAAAPPEALVLVGHSGAGPLLAQVGASQRAARRRLGGYVFLDAGLPTPRGASRLAAMETEDAEFTSELRAHLGGGGWFPEWTDAGLADDVPDPAVRRELLASLRPRDEAYFTEPLPAYGDWPDAPCGYLQTSPAYDVPARVAAGRGWPVVRRDLGHFAACTEPEATAGALHELLAAL